MENGFNVKPTKCDKGIPVCMRLWFFRLPAVVKDFPQSSAWHTNGRSPVCVLMWTCSRWAVRNRFPHLASSHTKRRSFLKELNRFSFPIANEMLSWNAKYNITHRPCKNVGNMKILKNTNSANIKTLQQKHTHTYTHTHTFMCACTQAQMLTHTQTTHTAAHIM